ncbi:serine hydrolase [Dysgonomonas sp. 216]|uniref:serine hydrolase domain-containing protein n=1 Tax=Dysgonomonas sp. 216 TaxID=2302934 RepID=UPI0013D16F4F|nr:serine hydrolase domain-containing protein [Dysgonomonas sp. 216]
MKKSYIYYCLAVLLHVILLGCNDNRKKDSDLRAELPALKSLDEKIASWVDSGYYEGVAIRVVKDNEVFFESCYGNYTDTTARHVASAGKWIVAATIAAVVDDGKLSWDDKVKKYLPAFTDAKGEATLRQLLSHTAGYPDYQPAGRKRDDYQTLEEAVSHIADLPSDTLPGTKYKYGGLAMQVAGRMAEIATGKDWETIFQEKLAMPLGMKYSRFVPVSSEGGFSPMLGGGFKTSVHDFSNFLSMFINNGLFNGKQVLSVEAVKEIESDQIKGAFLHQPEFAATVRQNFHNDAYGLGIWREEIDANRNATLMSSPGWAGAYPWADRKNNVYGFILAKVNVHKANANRFSSFYESASIPLIIRDAIGQKDRPEGL